MLMNCFDNQVIFFQIFTKFNEQILLKPLYKIEQKFPFI